MQHKEELTDAAISAAASKVTYVGSASVGIGWLTTNEAAVIIGILVGVVGLIVNIIFKWREDRRQERLFLESMKQYGQK